MDGIVKRVAVAVLILSMAGCGGSPEPSPWETRGIPAARSAVERIQQRVSESPHADAHSHSRGYLGDAATVLAVSAYFYESGRSPPEVSELIRSLVSLLQSESIAGSSRFLLASAALRFAALEDEGRRASVLKALLAGPWRFGGYSESLPREAADLGYVVDD